MDKLEPETVSIVGPVLLDYNSMYVPIQIPPRKITNVWHSNLELLLIEFYKDHRFLWDPRSDGHFNRRKRQSVLSDLAILLGSDANGRPFTIENIKAKFTNLRTTFQRQHKLVQESKASVSSAEEVFVPKWVHYNAMLFLVDAALTEDTMDSVTFSCIQQTPSQLFQNVCDGMASKIKQEEVEELDVLCENGTLSSPSPPWVPEEGHVSAVESESASQSPPPARVVSNKKKTKMNKLNARDEAFVEAVKILKSTACDPAFAPSAETAEDAFGKHVALTLKRIPSIYQRELAKQKIQAVLLEYIPHNI